MAFGGRPVVDRRGTGALDLSRLFARTLGEAAAIYRRQGEGIPPIRRYAPDAARNRGRILDAAAELFAAKGLSVGLHEIAHDAGVGVGTAYRRFPDKRQLIEALFEERLDRLAELAERALAADDPWDGLTAFLEQTTELEIQNRGLREIITGSDHGTALTARAAPARAPHSPPQPSSSCAEHERATLRADVVATDVPLLQFMLSSAAELDTPPDAPQLWRRYPRPRARRPADTPTRTRSRNPA